MEQFKFKEKTLNIDIEGKRFEIEMSSDFGSRMRKFAEESLARANVIMENPDPAQRTAETTEFISGVIDALLGSGSVDRIFESRERDLFDLSDVLLYICDAYNDYQRARIAKYAAYLPE